MQSSKPFLCLETAQSDNVCVICNGAFTKKEKQLRLGESCWLTFKRNAEIWAIINMPTDESKHHYADVYERVKDAEEAFGYVHSICRLEFGSKSSGYIKSYGTVNLARLC